jgi:transforming growth factor-beta-induced protein
MNKPNSILTTSLPLALVLGVTACATDTETDDLQPSVSETSDGGDDDGATTAGDDSDGGDTMSATTDTGDDDGGAEQSVYDVAASLDDYSVLVAAVDKAGLADALRDPAADLTVFAPDNQAFTDLLGAIGASGLDDLSAEQLRPILMYHVLGSQVDSVAATAAATNDEIVTGLGGSIQLSIDAGNIALEDTAFVEVADVQASNGIIHGIDAVILPSITDVVVSDSSFSNLATALVAADTDSSAPNLVGTLDDNAGDFTVFAPVDQAFADLVGALPAATGIGGLGDFSTSQLIPVLKYHVAGGSVMSSAITGDLTLDTLGGSAAITVGGGVAIDGANVTTVDILTANGVIHVIDGVILPSIADVVTTAPEFAQLAGLVGAADGDPNTSPKVGAALDGAAPSGAWTLFAPTNDAITGLSVTAPGGQGLTDILLFHALDGGVFASDALGMTDVNAPTLNGGEITVNGGTGVVITPADGGAANVVTTDYLTANGVIHAIDAVLLP